MSITYIMIASNPFFEAFWQSDFMGKLIFLALIALSVLSWTLLIYKYLLTKQARQASDEFKLLFNKYKQSPLSLEVMVKEESVNPFLETYLALKKYTMEVLNKNRKYSQGSRSSFLSHSDIDFVEAHVATTIANQTKKLEKDLYLLATTVTLSPFLGLLGTVWGILTAFSEMQSHASGNTNQMVLAGLSLALTTTVLGLINAIPAVVGNNYLKQTIRDLNKDMESFSNDMLASVELQYRQVDIR
jgi:biopolymer transport protein TolQ